MKTELTKEQSKHLIELGVPKEKASITQINEIIVVDNEEVYEWAYAFTLTDLLNILPKEITNRNDIDMAWNSLIECYVVGYGSIETSRRCAKELIDALYELTVWTIKNGHLKF